MTHKDILEDNRVPPYPAVLTSPFTGRVGIESFQRIPESSGVYWMLDEGRHLLFVGPAKNLRLRIMSYKYLNPDRTSRKLNRLLQQVRFLEWTEVPNETVALGLVNELRRRFRPPFNVNNTRTDSFLYIGFHWMPGLVHFALSPHLNELQSVNAFGAYRGRWLTQHAYGALLRLLWQSLHKDPAFLYPSPLTRPAPPDRYRITVPRGAGLRTAERWRELLEIYLLGQSSQLITEFYAVEDFARERNAPPFTRAWIRQDLDLLSRFFDHGPRRNEAFREQFSLSELLISQPLHDDLLVLARTRFRE